MASVHFTINLTIKSGAINLNHVRTRFSLREESQGVVGKIFPGRLHGGQKAESIFLFLKFLNRVFHSNFGTLKCDFLDIMMAFVIIKNIITSQK